MHKVKIGFIPSNWEAWDGIGWGEKMRDRCIAVFEGIPGLELVVPPKEMTGDGCVDAEGQADKVLDFFKKADIEGVILGNMTFGNEVGSVGVIINKLPTDIPILQFATRSGPIDEQGHRSTDTWCGQFMASSALKRRGRKFVHARTCWPEDESFKQTVTTFVKAVNAISRFKHARFGLIGPRPTLFESECFSEQALQKKFAQTVVPIDLHELFSKVDKISESDPEVRRIGEEISSSATMCETTDQSLINIARYEIALKQVKEQWNLDAMAVSCWSALQEKYGIAACSTFGRLTDQGIITACESDLLGAASMWIVYCTTLGEQKPHFMDWTDLHPSEPDVWLAWHCGNAPGSLCSNGCKPDMYRNERLIQWNPNCYGALELQLKAGPVTCLRLMEYDGEFTMFYGTGEVVHIPPFVRGSYGWIKVNDVFDWEEKMIESGMIHHGVLIHDAATVDALEMFCKFLDIDAVRGK
ncbi:MAG: L-fucose/L-arabinose isomerase family protein [Armatimonadota bacterium]